MTKWKCGCNQWGKVPRIIMSFCLFVSYIISKSYHSRTLWSMKIQGAIKWMNNISWKVDYECVYHRNGILCVHCFACVSPEKWETTEPNKTQQRTLVQKKKVKRNHHWMGSKVYKPIRSTNLEKYLLVETEKHRPNDNLRNRDRENIKVHSDSSNWSHNYHTIWP